MGRKLDHQAWCRHLPPQAAMEAAGGELHDGLAEGAVVDLE